MKATEFIVNALRKQGVTQVFGYPGGAIMPLYDALYDGGVAHLLARHEQGAVMAALGYARAGARVGVCIATSGPGATNLVTGLAEAMADSIPLVAFTGQVPFANLRSFDTGGDAGTLLSEYDLANSALATAPVVIDGLLLVGSGIGTRTSTGSGPSDISAGTPSPLRALCVPGTPVCNVCQNNVKDPREECDDGNDKNGDGCSATCESEDFQLFSGTAAGGSVQFIIDGVAFEVDTTPGMSGFFVAKNVAALINAHPGLKERGVIAGMSSGDEAFRGTVFSNGVITGVRSNDAGIMVGLVPPGC